MEIDWLAAAREIGTELVGLRRLLHERPELSLEESATAAEVAERLKALGLEPCAGIGGHGVTADLTGGRPGPRIALRADMDALPVAEETGLPFASRIPGRMHACGHDAHTAILYGAAKLLAPLRETLAGSIRFLFQPAEEVNAGAKAMIAAGALDGVDEIYGLHNLPTLSAGKAAVRRGAMMGSVDRFELTIAGKGGHGAMPDRCVDPIVAASAIVMSLQSAVSRELSPFAPAVVTVGSFRGGDTYNVIPERAVLTGTVRTFSPDVRETMEERLRRLAGGVAEAHRCRAELRYERQTPVLVNHDDPARSVERTIGRVLDADRLLPAEPVLAGEDFSVYLERIPGCFFWLGSGPENGAERAYGLHHPKFTLNEDCLPVGAALLAAIAAERLRIGG